MDSQYYPKTTGGSRTINEILPAEIAYYQEPIQFDKDMMNDVQPTWDIDIDSLMWDINGAIMGDADPYDFDLYFHRLWHLFIEIVKNTNPEASKQDSLVRWIVTFREMGVLTSSEEEIVVAKASNGQKMG